MNKEIFNLIDKQKLDVVSESIEKAHGLPNECYLNGHYTKIERKKIFEDKIFVKKLSTIDSNLTIAEFTEKA